VPACRSGHGTRGGLVAGGLFVLPGVLAIMALSWVYALYGNVSTISGKGTSKKKMATNAAAARPTMTGPLSARLPNSSYRACSRSWR
jgi:hypothetical protein